MHTEGLLQNGTQGPQNLWKIVQWGWLLNTWVFPRNGTMGLQNLNPALTTSPDELYAALLYINVF